MNCQKCGGEIFAVIHEDIGRGWLHEEGRLDRDHEAEPEEVN